MSLSNQFESLINSAKQVEESLNIERAKAQKIAKDYVEFRKKYDGAFKQLQQKLKEKDYEVDNLKELIADQKIQEEKVKNHVIQLSLEQKKLRDEIASFQEANDELMARDNEARATLLDNNKLKQTIAQLSTQIQGAHEKIIATRELADHTQKQFQSLMARTQAAETQLKKITVEAQQAKDARVAAEAELHQLAPMMREQADRRVETEREKARLEIYQEMAGKLERIRDDSETRLRSTEERANQRVSEAESERDRLMSHLRSLSDKATEQLGRAKQQVELAEAARLQVSLTAQQSLDAARYEAARVRLEMENLKRETNRVLIIERLKHQKESERLKLKIEQLEASTPTGSTTSTDDFSVEKWMRANLPKGIAIARPIEV